MRSNVNGPVTPVTCCSSQTLTGSTSIPSTAQDRTGGMLEGGRSVIPPSTLVGPACPVDQQRFFVRPQAACFELDRTERASEASERVTVETGQLGRPTPVTLPQLTAARRTPELGLAASIIVPPPT